ncbi:MAG: hypothetical protein H6707_06920 [Deltaproteobacteria bacterium]|nr:hypothetical protein [Deltaproteobacteria bacterium]
MPHNRSMILTLTLLASCTGRNSQQTDGAAALDVSRSSDTTSETDSQPPACTSLKQLGRVSLDVSTNSKWSLQVVEGGEGFVVAWHTQPVYASSLTGQLRLAFVDRQAKTKTPNGIDIGADNFGLRPSLFARSGIVSVLYQPASGRQVHLKQLDAQGNTLRDQEIALPSSGGPPTDATIRAAAIAPYGHDKVAALLAIQSLYPRLVTISDVGEVTVLHDMVTNQTVSSVSLKRRADRILATYQTINDQATHHMLGLASTVDKLVERGKGEVTHATARDSAYEILPSGAAALFRDRANDLYLQTFADDGTAFDNPKLLAKSVRAESYALAWGDGKLWLATERPANAGQHQLQALDSHGNPIGNAQPLQSCAGEPSAISMVWLDDRLAIVTANETIGDGSQSAVCVVVMGCQ